MKYARKTLKHRLFRTQKCLKHEIKGIRLKDKVTPHTSINILKVIGEGASLIYIPMGTKSKKFPSNLPQGPPLKDSSFITYIII